jgi:capsular polysaccharide biosynthesis protein
MKAQEAARRAELRRRKAEEGARKAEHRRLKAEKRAAVPATTELSARIAADDRTSEEQAPSVRVAGRNGFSEPQSQAAFFPVNARTFDSSDGPQTVEVAPQCEIVRGDVLVAWDIDERVFDRDAEFKGRSPAHRTFVNPPVLCSRVPAAVVATSAGIVLTEDGRWIIESVGKRHFASRVVDMDVSGRIRVDEPKRAVDEDVAVVFAAFDRRKIGNYWHWITEGMTRAAILQRAGVPDHTRILIPAPVLDLHRHSLAAIGINESRILEWTGDPTRFRTVFLPNLPQRHGDEPVAVAVSYLRECAAKFRNGQPTRRLWVSRRNASRRRVSNETDLLTVATELGFDSVLAETLTVGEQVELFAQAEAIAGPHGAGLTNAAFMAPGTKLAEAAPDLLKPRQKLYYWNLAATGRQRYAYCVGPDGAVAPERFRRVLEDLLASPRA